MVNIDWKNLGFDYVKTNVNARFYYKNGEWSEMEIIDDEYIKMHMSTTCLHYGLECFEGLKAFLSCWNLLVFMKQFSAMVDAV